MNELMTARDALVTWLSHGLLDAAWWQIALYALVTTHITIWRGSETLLVLFFDRRSDTFTPKCDATVCAGRCRHERCG